MFTARKVAQMAALFAAKQGGTINVLKLVKLLYLADRESMHLYGEPISFDKFVSMDNGPVLSKTLDYINGFERGSSAAQWDEWITARVNYRVSKNRDIQRDDLDELSDADIEVMNRIWARFGHMDQWQLVDYTHDYCKEWRDPHGTSIPITDIEILKALGKEGQEASFLAGNIQAQRELDAVFSRL